MNKNKQFCGIDISKDVFDVVDHNDNHHQYPNDQSGFKELYKILTKQSHCVMEVTGSYYQSLATWLHSKSIDVSVVNPLSVKRFIQMRLKTSKTDKADARMIRLYGEAENPDLWQPPSQYIIEANELHKLIVTAIEARGQPLKTNFMASESKGITKPVRLSLQFIVRSVIWIVRCQPLEMKLEEVVKAHQADLIIQAMFNSLE